MATLIDDVDSSSYGMAFRLKASTASSALEYLNMRESRLGGYVTHTTTFYPRGDRSLKPFSVVLFTATPENELWLGDAPLEDIAEQGLHSTGEEIVCLIMNRDLILCLRYYSVFHPVRSLCFVMAVLGYAWAVANHSSGHPAMGTFQNILFKAL